MYDNCHSDRSDMPHIHSHSAIVEIMLLRRNVLAKDYANITSHQLHKKK